MQIAITLEITDTRSGGLDTIATTNAAKAMRERARAMRSGHAFATIQRARLSRTRSHRIMYERNTRRKLR